MTIVARDPSVFVHEKALCESEEVGPRTRIWAFAHVMKGARMGADCNIGGHAFIESGARLGDRVTVKNAVLVWDRVTIEDDVFLGPNAVFTNDMRPRSGVFKKEADGFLDTLVRKGATVGANATIVCGITLFEYCLVGAGSVVIDDVAPYALVVGSPARRIGWVCACGERLGDSLACLCGRAYDRVGADGGLTPREGA